MTTRVSAGLVMVDAKARLLLVHPGGPFFAKRDEGVWSIPKGLCVPGESRLETASREFREELGFDPAPRRLFALGRARQSAKTVYAWAFFGEWDPSRLQSNGFECHWPPRSGRVQTFPEVDRAAFFELSVARTKVIAAQRELLERAVEWHRLTRDETA